MTITINATGAERKRLVNTISEWLGEEPHYCGAPTFAYEIARFTVEKNGNLTFSDLVDSEVVEHLLEHLPRTVCIPVRGNSARSLVRT